MQGNAPVWCTQPRYDKEYGLVHGMNQDAEMQGFPYFPLTVEADGHSNMTSFGSGGVGYLLMSATRRHPLQWIFQGLRKRAEKSQD